MDDGAPSQAGLRIGNKRLSNLPFNALFRGFLLYGFICLVILYCGAFTVGHSPGFAFLVATEVGEPFGDSLTSERASVDAALRHLQVFDLRTSTNKNQKIPFTTIRRVALHREFTRVTRVEVDGFSCDVRMQKSGACLPSRFSFLSELPLINQMPFLAKTLRLPDGTEATDASTPAVAKPAPEPVAEDEEEARARRFNLAELPSLQVSDGTIRILTQNGEVLAEIKNLNLSWVPAAAAGDGRDRLELQARYTLAHRKVPEQNLKIAVSARAGHFSIDTLEAEQTLLMEIYPFLSSRFNPPSGKGKVQALPAKEASIP